MTPAATIETVPATDTASPPEAPPAGGLSSADARGAGER
jgi:hypothetical protein